jgi:hypothetical protein
MNSAISGRKPFARLFSLSSKRIAMGDPALSVVEF